MPFIKAQHVISVSSEDKVFCADNLLNPGSGKKWISARAGEAQVCVVMQLEKSSEIGAIDIGNENSAFVEVLVGKSSAKTDQDFKVLMVASSFMTPIESKSLKGGNKVRIFGKEKLESEVAKEKWDKVKVVCRQPFNKNIQYGLSFIKFRSTPLPGEDENGDESAAATDPSCGDSGEKHKKQKVGRFLIYDSDDDDDGGGDNISTSDRNMTPGSLFATSRQDKEVEEKKKLKGAAAVRAASKQADVSTPTQQGKAQANVTKSDETKALKTSVSSNKGAGASQKAAVKADVTKPFSQLLKGVTFALSGFQNPERGELRQQAIDMGAYYKPDWGKDCTHLICAFANTPKFDQVAKTGGKIVTKKWIIDSHKQKKLLSWKSYELKSKVSVRKQNESDDDEEEDDDDEDTEEEEEDSEEEDEWESEDDDYKPSTSKRKRPSRASNMAAAGGSSRERGRVDSGSERSDSGDTDDEIQRFQTKRKKDDGGDGVNGVNRTDPPGEVEGGGMEEQRRDTSGLELPKLPDFLKNKHFFLYGEFDEKEKKQITRYITAFNGKLHDYMSEDVRYVISNSDWDEHFDKALCGNSELQFIKPAWVFECARQSRLLPHQKHVIVPK